jgi:hypothetical protein
MVAAASKRVDFWASTLLLLGLLLFMVLPLLVLEDPVL